MDSECAQPEGVALQHLTPQPDCRHEGHELSPERPLAYYPDGVITGYCATCGCRIQITWFPGGTAAARGRAVANQVLAQVQPPSTHQVRQLQEALESMRRDQAELEVAVDVVALALKRVLE